MKKPNFERCDAFVEKFESVAVQMGLPDTDAQFERLREQMREYHAARREAGDGPATFLTGVDLGTACVVLAVLDEHRQPVAGAYQYADVVRDGMVVDYMGAIRLVRTMKERLEEVMDAELYFAAAAIPPGTDTLDGGAVKNVTEAAGFEVTALLDEPSAANKLLGLRNGAIIDIGGGTTGISILQDGHVVMTDDEPTGGTHVTLVVAGACRKTFEEAELYKRDEANHKVLFPIIRPVMEKMAVIIRDMLDDYEEEFMQTVDELVLVGGTACFTGLETELEKVLGIPTYKPNDPLFVTPLGIALSCEIEQDVE